MDSVTSKERGCYVMDGVMYTSHADGSETSRKATDEEVLLADALLRTSDELRGCSRELAIERRAAQRAADEPLSGDALLKHLEAQCQAIWRTGFTIVCTLPKGHEGDHRADCGYTFNGEVDVRAAQPPGAGLEQWKIGFISAVNMFEQADDRGREHLKALAETYRRSLTKPAAPECPECGAMQPPGATFHKRGCSSLGDGS